MVPLIFGVMSLHDCSQDSLTLAKAPLSQRACAGRAKREEGPGDSNHRDRQGPKLTDATSPPFGGLPKGEPLLQAFKHWEGHGGRQGATGWPAPRDQVPGPH